MKVFRLSKKAYSKHLSGKGASKSNNRWNSKGTELIYTAESRALAMAEVAVHLTLATLPSDFVMMELELPNTMEMSSLETDKLPHHWSKFPPIQATQQLGDQFISSARFCVLKVPSAVVQGDYNYLLNPQHPDFKNIKIVECIPFPFDKRIVNH